jgi:hypothetical protein
MFAMHGDGDEGRTRRVGQWNLVGEGRTGLVHQVTVRDEVQTGWLGRGLDGLDQVCGNLELDFEDQRHCDHSDLIGQARTRLVHHTSICSEVRTGWLERRLGSLDEVRGNLSPSFET